MSEEQLSRLYDVKAVADYFGKSVPTIYCLIRSGQLKAIKVGG